MTAPPNKVLRCHIHPFALPPLRGHGRQGSDHARSGHPHRSGSCLRRKDLVPDLGACPWSSSRTARTTSSTGSGMGSSRGCRAPLARRSSRMSSGLPPLPRLPRPAGAPGHLDPQPVSVHRNPGHHPDAHRADQHPAAALPAPRHRDPADLDVARTPPGQPVKSPGQTRNHLSNRP